METFKAHLSNAVTSLKNLSPTQIWQLIALTAVFLLLVSPLFASFGKIYTPHQDWQYTRIDFNGTFGVGGTASETLKTGFDIDRMSWFYAYTDGYVYTNPIKFTGRSGQTLTFSGDASKAYHIELYDDEGR